MYVFDTDHLSLFQRGHVPLKKRIFSISTEQLGITIISAEEVLRGRLAQVRRAGCADERIKAYYWFSKTLEFLQSFPILSYDTQAERHIFKRSWNAKFALASRI